MSTSISQQIQDIQAQIAEATRKKSGLEGKLRALDELLGSISSQRAQYQLLEEICIPLEKLNQTGAASLFREVTGNDPEKQMQQVRGVVAEFRQKITAIEQSRGVLQADIQNELASIRLLNDQLAGLHEKEKHFRNELKPGRQSFEIPYVSNRATVLPWSKQGEDERRFRRIVSSIIFIAVAFGGLIPILKQPVEESNGVVVPERIARIIKKKQEAKLELQKPPEKAAEKNEEKSAEKEAEKPIEKPVEKAAEKAEKPAEKVAEKTPPGETTKPIESAAQTPAKSVESKGVLAFKNDMASLLKDSSTSKMGADARISINAKRTTGDILQRSIIVSQATGGSGGINTATISRQGDGGGGQRIVETEKKFIHVESATSIASSGADRPLSKGGVSRTDEEIQIVFDQYKSALYRIYNRELRSNPTLRGKMVLLIVIEPDGHVSSCSVKSTDLASAALSADIVARVLKFEFGPKPGAPAMTILYPIDFLPAN